MTTAPAGLTKVSESTGVHMVPTPDGVDHPFNTEHFKDSSGTSYTVCTVPAFPTVWVGHRGTGRWDSWDECFFKVQEAVTAVWMRQRAEDAFD